MNITLQTASNNPVRSAVIPNFVPPPQVVTWGSRFFVRNELLSEGINEGVYVEGQVWPLEVSDKE